MTYRVILIRAKSFLAWYKDAQREAAGTCAHGRVWLPEVTAADLSADNSFGTLQDVAWITLEHHMVTRLPAVPAAGPISRHARVVTGGCSGDCRNT